ncbi:AGAP008320-PA-like protein [Anopheles sinensis]|uniref:AGAP008320-PA-like protein n=1 Tax=Anopheles sinensis TaxID=74873 RepID=A0A084VZQ3_ANOSI|nr:AGAP008320-PA-like protein [Anopheles sinensis]
METPSRAYVYQAITEGHQKTEDGQMDMSVWNTIHQSVNIAFLRTVENDKSIVSRSDILPSQPVILDRWGRVINSTIIGPKEKGDDITLTCGVVGGKLSGDLASGGNSSVSHKFSVGI